MDKSAEKKGVQINCPLCKKPFPVRVQELSGKVRLSVRCPHCKRISEITLLDTQIAPGAHTEAARVTR